MFAFKIKYYEKGEEKILQGFVDAENFVQACTKIMDPEEDGDEDLSSLTMTKIGNIVFKEEMPYIFEEER